MGEPGCARQSASAYANRTPLRPRGAYLSGLMAFSHPPSPKGSRPNSRGKFDPYKTGSYTPPPWKNLESSDPRLGDLLVLVDGTAAHAYSPGYFSVAHQRDTAGEVDDPTVVGRLEAVERLPRLRHPGEVLGRHKERGRGEGLVYGDVYATEPGVFHARERLQVPPVVHDRDVHGLPDLPGLLHGGLDHRLGLLEQDRGPSSCLHVRLSFPLFHQTKGYQSLKTA